MKRNLMVLSVVVLMLGSLASAAVKEGDTEVNLLGGWTSVSGAGNTTVGGVNVNIKDSDALLLSGSLAQFVTPNIQVGGAVMGAWMDLLGVADVDVYALGGLMKYHFTPDKEYVPYVGLSVMWGNGDVDATGNAADGDADGLVWGPNAGVRFELNANNDFYAQVDYLMMEGDLGDVVDDLQSIMFGIIHTFK